jgi:heat shock protein HtpX
LTRETAGVHDHDGRCAQPRRAPDRRAGVEALYVSPLDIPMFDGDDDELLSQDLFPDSHPPTRERIDRLRALAGTIET